MSSPRISTTVSLDTITALCKRRGFVYPAADIYGGLNGVYDFGPLGTLMKENIRAAWIKAANRFPGEVVFLDGSILGPYAVWKASGHVDNFNDPMVDCLQCKHRYRADDGSVDLAKACPHCGARAWTEVKQFNMMFSTQVGASAEQTSLAYLRPETAQTVFVNLKNVLATSRVKIPFGIAQIGKAFRNEITPKQFLFRVREFEQMELEWFCKAADADHFFEQWIKARMQFFARIGLEPEKTRIRPHEKNELAHYSVRCSDVEYEFPFGWKELEGIAHRGTFDMTQHAAHSGKDLAIFDEETKTSFMPTVIECSVGIGRLFLALLFDAYREEVVVSEQENKQSSASQEHREQETREHASRDQEHRERDTRSEHNTRSEHETRIVLKLHPSIAPIKAAFLPLSKQLSEPMMQLYRSIKNLGYSVQFDETASIGKRYRRQDEIGTPLCFTYDFDSATTQTVTVRDRDTMKQERIAIDAVEAYIATYLDSQG
jgi:glycyl-tRNA synthetase